MNHADQSNERTRFIADCIKEKTKNLQFRREHFFVTRVKGQFHEIFYFMFSLVFSIEHHCGEVPLLVSMRPRFLRIDCCSCNFGFLRVSKGLAEFPKAALFFFCFG